MKILYTSEDGYKVRHTNSELLHVSCPKKGHMACTYVSVEDAPNPVTDEYKLIVTQRVQEAISALRSEGCNMVVEVPASHVADALGSLSSDEVSTLVETVTSPEEPE